MTTAARGTKGQRSKGTDAAAPASRPVSPSPPLPVSPSASPDTPSTITIRVPRDALRVVCEQWELYCAVIPGTFDRDWRFDALNDSVPAFRRRLKHDKAHDDASKDLDVVETPAAWRAVLFFTCTQKHKLFSDLRMTIIPALTEWEGPGSRRVPSVLIAGDDAESASGGAGPAPDNRRAVVDTQTV